MGYLTNNCFFSVPRYITHENFSKKKVPLLGDQFPSSHDQPNLSKKSGCGGLPVQALPGNGGHHLKATFGEAF